MQRRSKCLLVALATWLGGCGAIQSAQPMEDLSVVHSATGRNSLSTADFPVSSSEHDDTEWLTAETGVKRMGDDIMFDGDITREAVAKVKAELLRAPAKRLLIRSWGGGVGSGIELGELIRDAKLIVVVYKVCGGSCANYVFTAGSKRVLGGLVIWYGSIEQKDLREYVLCGRQTSSISRFGKTLPPHDRETIESWKETRARQAAFFQSIGVDEYITRAGQEPVFVEDGWFTYDIATMATFGLHDVTALAKDYGTREFCSRLNASRSGGKRLTCLAVTDEMLSYERTRRERGEECQADGTLRVRQQ